MQRIDLASSAAAHLLQPALAALRSLPFFEELPDELLARLARQETVVRLEPGEILIREGDPSATEMYVLIDGALVVTSNGKFIQRLDRRGDIVGELAVLQAPPRTADVTAETAALALAIRPDTVGLPEFKGVATVFYRMLSHTLANKLRMTASQSRQQIDRVSREATIDSLTGLANRKRLDEFLAALPMDGAGPPAALIMVDVDHFKHYNDHNGHPMGDAVLAKIGMILQAHIRQGDLAARYGGEEFAVVLPNCAVADAARIAEKLRSTVHDETFPHGERQPLGRLTITLGVADSRGRRDARELLRAADESLYRGKSNGRDAVVAAPDA